MELTVAMWEQARAFVRSMRILAGPGIRLQWHADGTIISATANGNLWANPFRCALHGRTGASIAPGYINGSFIPEIKKVPLTGTVKEPVPKLDWGSRLQLGQDQTGYIAVEVTCGADWNIIPEHGVEVVQVAYFDRLDDQTPPEPYSAGSVPLLPGRKARWPLARIKQRKTGDLDLFQVEHGDLKFRAQPRTAGGTVGRAFFW